MLIEPKHHNVGVGGMRCIRFAAMAAIVIASAPLSAAPPSNLVLAVRGEPADGFDPTLGWGRYGNPLFHSTLLRRDSDLNLVNDLATSAELSPDRRIWRVTIRADALFSDGHPLTASDVAYTFRTAATAGGLTDLSVLDDAEAIDATTVQFRLKRPWITFVDHLASVGIVPERRHGPGYARNPIGSGPWMLREWREGQQLVVEPNPHWYGAKTPFPRITFLFLADDTAFAAARAGRVHLVAVQPAMARQVPRAMRAEVRRSVDNRGLMFPMRPATGGTTADGRPIGNDITADPAIRLAVNVGIDRTALVDLVLDGRGRPAHGPADGLPWDAAAAVPDADPTGARRILAEAGWNDRDGDGIVDKDGRPARFDILYPASDGTRQALAVAVADQLRAVGIRATPLGRSWDDIRRNAHSNVVVYGWGAHSPLEVWSLYHTDNAGRGSFNPGFYASAAVDAHLDAAQAAPDFAASLAHWRRAGWDGTTGFSAKGDAAWAWLVNLDHVYLVDRCLDLGPAQIHPHGHGFPITHGINGWRWTCP